MAQSIDDDLEGSAVRPWHLIEERLKAGFEPYEGPEVAGSEVNWRLRY